MYRSLSPQIVRSIEGHGRLITRYPPASGVFTGRPSSSTMSAKIPGSGLVQEPGLVGVTPGIGVIMTAPVSVCHHVSTMGQRSPPMTLWYHIHASGLIGSPTLPSNRSLPRLYLAGMASPNFMSARMAVGAVYRMSTPCDSQIFQKRPPSGKVGAPSYMSTVAPAASGP